MKPKPGSGIMPAVTVDIPMPQGAAIPRAARMVKVAHAPAFITALVDAGIVPPNCKRIVIDCNADSMVTIDYEVYADQRMNDQGVLDAIFGLGLEMKESAG